MICLCQGRPAGIFHRDVVVIQGESDTGMCHGWDIFFEHRLILLLFYWQFIEPKRERQPVHKPDKPLHEELPPRRSGMEPSHWKTSIFPLNLDKEFPPHWGRGQTIEHRRSGFPYLRAIPQKNLKYFRGVYLSATASELKQQLFRVRLCMLRSCKIFPQILR